jgi:hypothetical protein
MPFDILYTSSNKELDDINQDIVEASLPNIVEVGLKTKPLHDSYLNTLCMKY